MGANCDVAIAGGGIVGAACAAECAAAGLSVTVVEPGPVGGGATAAGMGHIVVMDDSPAQMALTRYSRQLWMERASELPAEIEYLACGTIWVAADEEEFAEVRRKKRVCDAEGVCVEVLDARQLAEAEPNLRPGLAGGLWVPDDATIYPPCAARFLLEEARTRGAALLLGKRVVKMCGGVMKLDDGSEVGAGVVINATGAWAPELTPGIEVRKRKGHLAITDRYPGFVRAALVELGYLKSAHSSTGDSVAFNAQPRRTGHVLIGSSRQFGSEGAQVEAHMLQRMLGRACEYMPRLGELAVIRTWTGFRAATPDKLPLIGPAPEDARLWLATGHEGLGITTSLATGRLVADMLSGRTPAIACEPYLPGRKDVGRTPGRTPRSAADALVGLPAEGRPGGLPRTRRSAPQVADSADSVTVSVNGTSVTVPPGAMVSAAVAIAGAACRTSVTGEPRGPLCGMGICFECRVTVDGRPHIRGCQVPCREGMEVRTDG
jgi:D-hydroxyproline dehydrogenase subunit beta